jgi:hypothetical protein
MAQNKRNPRGGQDPAAGAASTADDNREAAAGAAASNGRADAGRPGADPTTPTLKLLTAAKRSHDHKRGARGLSRQLDISLRGTPIPEVYFRIWPDAADEYPVALLKASADSERKEIYVVSGEIAELPYIVDRARDAKLIPCITTTGRLYVWVMTIPNQADRMGFRVHAALQRVAEAARRAWIMISWDNNGLHVHDPKEPITDEPRWPEGQSLEEIYEIALHGAFIDRPDHPVIRQFNTISREA